MKNNAKVIAVIVLAATVGFGVSANIPFFTVPGGFHIDEPLVPQPATSTDWGFFANGTSGTLDIIGEEFRFIPASNDEYREPVLVLRRDGSASLSGNFDASVLSAPRLSLGSISNIFKDRFEMESGFVFRPENGEELTYDATEGWGIMRLLSTGETYLDPLVTRSTDNVGSDSALKPENGDELKYNESEGWGIMRILSTGETYLDPLVTRSTDRVGGGSSGGGGLWSQSGSDIYYNIGDVMIGTNTQLGAEALTVSGGMYADWYGDYGNGTYYMDLDSPATSLLTAGDVGIGMLAPMSRLDVGGSLRVTGSALNTLTGSIDPIASTAVTGAGTLFMSELLAGDRIVVTGETRTVTAIASDLSLTVDAAFSDNANDTSPDRLPAALIVRNSSGNLGFVVGDNGNLAIGQSASIDDLTTVNVMTNSSDITGRKYGIENRVNFTPSATVSGIAGRAYGIYNRVVANTPFDYDNLYGSANSVATEGSANSDYIKGTGNWVYNDGTGTVDVQEGASNWLFNNSGTANYQYATSNNVYNYSGTTSNQIGSANIVATSGSGSSTNSWGAVSLVINSGTGTIADANGYKVHSAVNSGGGSIINNAGLVINSQTVGTNNSLAVLGQGTIPAGNFSIYSSSTDDSYFAGNLGVGISSPQSLMSIDTPLNATRRYLQIDVESGAPPAGDCDSDTEAGRMFVETSGGTGAYVLYICTGATDGWDTLTLSD